ncbi:hypothetical protein B9Z19DRAFT_1122037 [Tuber borchii]|uniref:Thioredoxin domain-containing protein n=1 Tax=Tuber borchii TaxID=42251 RepID=A0A2T7A1H5_TUBBO|nr:hypothetical protein B9Z19DRAFT_1122037 [Tuber borchii]
MYTDIENPMALNTHLQDDRFDYVILYFYMAPVQCCADTLNAIQEVSRNPRTHGISFLAIDLSVPDLSDVNASFGVTKVPELSVRGQHGGSNIRLTIGAPGDVSSALRRYCGIDLNSP